MKWVKHDTDANQDAKLQNVLLDYGLEGYGLYWYCIELIAHKIDKDSITFELEHDARIIARNTGCTPQKVEEMMRYFVKLGLFEDSTGVITCLKLAKRLDQSMTSNPEMRAIIEGLKSHDKVMTKSAKPMQDKIRLDKTRTDKKEDNIDWDDFKNFYNETMPNNKVATITDKRKKHIRSMLKSTDRDIDTLKAAVEHAANSTAGFWPQWRNGNTDKNGKYWAAMKFDFYMRESTFLKALED